MAQLTHSTSTPSIPADLPPNSKSISRAEKPQKHMAWSKYTGRVKDGKYDVVDTQLTGASDVEGAQAVYRSDLQRVETELDAVAVSQQVEAREVSRLKEAIKSLHDDLSSIKKQLASNQSSNSGGRPKKKIPPVLSVSTYVTLIYGSQR